MRWRMLRWFNKLLDKVFKKAQKRKKFAKKSEEVLLTIKYKTGGQPSVEIRTKLPVTPVAAAKVDSSGKKDLWEDSFIDFVEELPRQERATRRFHLGLDWGTSFTKLILRDYGQGEKGNAFVLMPEGAGNGFRYPSVTFVDDGKIYFGTEAELRRVNAGEPILSLKMLVIDPKRFCSSAPGSSKLSYKDLAMLFLSHTISLGMNTAEMLAKRADKKAIMGMTLGVPTEQLETAAHSSIYLRLAQTAHIIAMKLGVDPQSMTETEAMDVIAEAHEMWETGGYVTDDPENYHQWLRPELGAAMLWGFKSPAIAPGLYSCVDVGAWTTDVSFFRIHSRARDEDFEEGVEKYGIAFYGGASRPPGMNFVDELLAKELKMARPEELRGKEEQLLNDKIYPAVIDEAVDRFFDTYRMGFNSSYNKERNQPAWCNLNVMVIGGGSKVPKIKRRFKEFPIDGAGWRDPILLSNLGIPPDLYNIPSDGIAAKNQYQGDIDFLHVAYGLSVHSGDFPETTLSTQMEPFTPEPRVRRFKSPEELGYSDK